NTELATIYRIVSRANFFLKNYDDSLKYANKSQEYALQIKDYDLVAQNYYHRSAIYRVAADNAKNSDQKIKYKNIALNELNQAVALLKKETGINLQTTATIYFNFGALLQDIEPSTTDLSDAVEYFNKAIGYYTQLNKNYDSL